MQSDMVGYAGSPICIVHADMTLTRSKVKVKTFRGAYFQDEGGDVCMNAAHLFHSCGRCSWPCKCTCT